MSIVGLNYISFYCASVSGSSVSVPTSGWTVNAESEGSTIVPGSVYPMSGDNYTYVLEQNLPVGAYSCRISAPNVVVTPPIVSDNAYIYSTDAIYARFLSGPSIPPPTGQISSSNFNVVAGYDDCILIITIPASAVDPVYGGDGSLTGWNFSLSCSSVPSISGGSAVVTDSGNRLVEITIPHTLLPSSLLSTYSSITVDVRGVSSTPYQRTVYRLNIALSSQ